MGDDGASIYKISLFIAVPGKMQRHRFYAKAAQFAGSSVALDSDESHHLTRVLRLGEGARVFVFDGEGNEWTCEVSRIAKGEVQLILVNQLTDIVESPLKLNLAQALIKSDKFDWVVQKTTELGVARITPLITQHSDIRRKEEKIDHRLQRWRRIALEALKQCGRRKLVEISDPIDFVDFCQKAIGKNNLIFSERGGGGLREAASKMGSINQLNLCVGAEGGWSDDELLSAEKNEFIPIHLGPRILRTETAAIAAVALVQCLFGDVK
jgi:16S rRNA (uracil1498-N3)-methyltransferase